MAKKKLTQEEFQEFVIEQFGTLHTDLSELRQQTRDGLAEVSRKYRRR